MPGHVSLLSSPGALHRNGLRWAQPWAPGAGCAGVPAAGRGRCSPSEPSAAPQSCAPAAGRAAA